MRPERAGSGSEGSDVVSGTAIRALVLGRLELKIMPKNELKYFTL